MTMTKAWNVGEVYPVDVGLLAIVRHTHILHVTIIHSSNLRTTFSVYFQILFGA